MSESDNGDTDSEQSDPTYTLDVNGRRYAMNEEFRAAIQERARREFRENETFSCWWKLANKDDYTDEDWEENNHEQGDPILVIETIGVMVPWDQLDELEVEMKDISQSKDDADYHEDEMDSGSGMKSVDKDDVETDDPEQDEESNRTHFPLTPQDFEDIPDPDGEDENKIPPKPVSMDGDPALVWWIPSNPDLDERWSAGEAIAPTHSWVEWNVQAKADDIRPKPDEEDKPNSHDHFESLLKHHECEQVGEYSTAQDTPDEEAGQVKRKGKDAYEEGRYGGGHFHV